MTLREKCPYFPAFRLNTERYSVYLRIHSEFGKMRTRMTPNTEAFYAVEGSFKEINVQSDPMNASFTHLLNVFKVNNYQELK